MAAFFKATRDYAKLNAISNTVMHLRAGHFCPFKLYAFFRKGKNVKVIIRYANNSNNSKQILLTILSSLLPMVTKKTKKITLKTVKPCLMSTRTMHQTEINNNYLQL